MRLNTVKTFDVTEMPVLAYSYEAYAFDDKRRWPWLQKLCFRILRKLGCQKTFDFYTTTHVYSDLDTSKKLHEQIFQALGAVTGDARQHPENLIVYMGKKEFREIVCDEEVKQSMSFRTTMAVSHRTYQDQIMTDFFGVTCQVVPWIEGFAVVPWPTRPINEK